VARANPKGQTIIGRGAASATPGYDSGSFNVCFAEVEVDTETGEVTVLNTVTVEDMGTVVNRVGAEHQVISAHLWGKAYGFYEEHLYDKPSGVPLTTNFLDYKILTIKDNHKQQNDICTESYDKMGPFGAKGTGEPPIGPAAPAIANAIYNAIGVRLKEFPATPDIILKALKAKGGA
jgi:xanthine dehydrogenase molybdenum-binding subunit